MKKLFLLLLSFNLLVAGYAQDKNAGSPKTKREKRKEEKQKRINEIIRQEEEGVMTFRKHFVFGAKLTTDGYGGFLEMGRAKTLKKGMLYQFEITERKHPKEEKIQSLALNNSYPFVFGKMNFFYPVKLGVQQQILLGNKGNKNGVSVTGNIGGGLALGLLRPYEVQIQDSTGNLKYITYESDSLAYADAYLHGAIVSGPSLGRGWSGLKFKPGIYAKAAVRFDYGQYNEMVNALEIGLVGEFYAQKIPQMIYNKQKQFFLTAFVAIVLGKRK